jgi:hypothetical protein
MDGSSSAAGSAVSSASAQVETTEVPTDSRPLLTTSFENYTVTEGLLLLILLTLLIGGVVRWFRG